LKTYNDFDVISAQLFVDRGLLTDITIAFDKKYNSGTTYYKEIKQSLINNFGEPNGEPLSSDILGTKYRSVNLAWNIKEQIEGGHYTTIDFLFVQGKYLFLNFSSPFSKRGFRPMLRFDDMLQGSEIKFSKSFDRTILGKWKTAGRYY